MKTKLRLISLIALALTLSLLFTGCDIIFPINNGEGNDPPSVEAVDLALIPEFSNSPFVYINDNTPFFTEEEIVTESYEYYSPLDSLGRCGVTRACVGVDLKPTIDRDDAESISGVKPSGWKNKQYSSELVDGGWIYNRSHLIGWQLTGEAANECNLITGTRYFNVEGMLPFENMVADYLREEPDNHVMYRVTPIYLGDELVARGVLMEAYSVEDNGEALCYCVYVYNNQPGIQINYLTGDSWEDGTVPPVIEDNESNEPVKYFINTQTEKFHKSTCRYATGENCVESELTLEELMARYSPCGTCDP